jgi:hypothetical protein
MERLIVELQFGDENLVKVKSISGDGPFPRLKESIEESLVDFISRTSFPHMDVLNYLVCVAQVISWYDFDALSWEVSMVGRGGNVHKLEHSF